MKRLLPILAAIPFLISYNSQEEEKVVPELLVYCGITMAHPIKDIAAIIEKEKNVKILISQGGSEDLFKSLSTSLKGDLYLPGSASYRDKHLHEGFFGDYALVGYNQAALIVRKGNPKNVTSDIKQLLRKDLAAVVSNANTGSIGRETKQILDQHDLYRSVLENSVFVTTDSRNLNRALREGEADVIMNWRATAFFEENRDYMDIVDLSIKDAEPKKLILNTLTFSKQPEISRYFIEVATSERGQKIFRDYGFLGAADIKQ
ncbi:substrate-binding domain-containing protein [Marinomonas algarum]|uniref:Substrate-binding domain-containing protein n=1 Tax=Marinomonas algarum TaxID=2883105 RepID=A0A9X1IMC4_9GAMM|nr:substrate-binding domain-containing protein [Marinomonas algarum]MCB5160696.1 substrate-binding domain-containing protein [Marinomonas algarum]